MAAGILQVSQNRVVSIQFDIRPFNLEPGKKMQTGSD